MRPKIVNLSHLPPFQVSNVIWKWFKYICTSCLKAALCSHRCTISLGLVKRAFREQWSWVQEIHFVRHNFVAYGCKENSTSHWKKKQKERYIFSYDPLNNITLLRPGETDLEHLQFPVPSMPRFGEVLIRSLKRSCTQSNPPWNRQSKPGKVPFASRDNYL